MNNPVDSRPLVAITLGDPSGIGPEVTARALSSPLIQKNLIPVVYGDEVVWKQACAQAEVKDRLVRCSRDWEVDREGDQLAEKLGILVPVTALQAANVIPGKPSAEGGAGQLAFLLRAIEDLQAPASRLEALCTAPLNKAQVHRAGLSFSGHTELLAERFHSRVLMMLAGPVLRVAVHTTHIALSRVPGKISLPELVTDLQIMNRELSESFGIARPRLAVCALNPHAGEDGLFGDEEAGILTPAIERAQAQGIDVQGPFPADGLFPQAARGQWDAVLAMYHDQGLTPFKLLHFDEGVNVTLGLAIPRTSPDHGVAYDLAGKGRARSHSMEAALNMAAQLAKGRRKTNVVSRS